MAGFRADEELVRRLARLLEETGLTEIEIGAGRRRVRVSRGALAAAPAPAQPASAAGPPANGALGDGPEGPGPGEDPAEAFAAHPGAVTSPMVGTLYLSPSPGAAPFVQPGQEVSEGDQLFIIEAMKTMNPISAHRSGKLSRVFAPDASPVEYGAVLAVIE